jgi:hypothetical protein
MEIRANGIVRQSRNTPRTGGCGAGERGEKPLRRIDRARNGAGRCRNRGACGPRTSCRACEARAPHALIRERGKTRIALTEALPERPARRAGPTSARRGEPCCKDGGVRAPPSALPGTRRDADPELAVLPDIPARNAGSTGARESEVVVRAAGVVEHALRACLVASAMPVEAAGRWCPRWAGGASPFLLSLPGRQGLVTAFVSVLLALARKPATAEVNASGSSTGPK